MSAPWTHRTPRTNQRMTMEKQTMNEDASPISNWWFYMVMLVFWRVLVRSLKLYTMEPEKWWVLGGANDPFLFGLKGPIFRGIFGEFSGRVPFKEWGCWRTIKKKRHISWVFFGLADWFHRMFREDTKLLRSLDGETVSLANFKTFGSSKG